MICEQRCELSALRQILVEKGIVLDGEWDERVERFRREEYSDLLDEVRRRAFERQIERRPKQ